MSSELGAHRGHALCVLLSGAYDQSRHEGRSVHDLRHVRGVDESSETTQATSIIVAQETKLQSEHENAYGLGSEGDEGGFYEEARCLESGVEAEVFCTV